MGVGGSSSSVEKLVSQKNTIPAAVTEA